MTLEEFRMQARAFCEVAVAGERGVRVTDPIYRQITEERDPGPNYSSCGDLCHAMLFSLGMRESWVNRAEHKGFKWGMNIARLVASPVGGGAGGLARRPKTRELFETGDVIAMWSKPDTTDAHVCVVDSFDGAVLHTWDYGQGPMAKAKWDGRDILEGRRRERQVVAASSDGLWVVDGGRVIRSVIPLAAVHARLFPRVPENLA